MTDNAYESVSPWTWRDRLREKLYPSRWHTVEVPERLTPRRSNMPLPEGAVVCTTCVHLDWPDRLRVLVSGLLVVQTKTATEREPGAADTNSGAWPVWREPRR